MLFGDFDKAKNCVKFYRTFSVAPKLHPKMANNTDPLRTQWVKEKASRLFLGAFFIFTGFPKTGC
jgi:hypothetical protein